MLLAALVVGVFMALGPQAVLSFHSVSFSAIEQCGFLNISFSGGSAPASTPLFLKIIPFSSTPLSILIPSFSWDVKASLGVAVAFLPLQAGTSFIASLDDSAGQPIAPVSDIIQVQPSSNSLCLSFTSTNPVYTFTPVLTEDASFTLMFNATVVANVPLLRAFEVGGQAFYLRHTGTASSGTAQYFMNITAGQDVVLLADDGHGHAQTSPLKTVQGTILATSSSSPLHHNPTTMPSQSIAKDTRLSKGVIIGIAIGVGGLVLGAAIVASLCFYRRRFRRRVVFETVYAKPLPPLPSPSPPPVLQREISRPVIIYEPTEDNGRSVLASSSKTSAFPKSRASSVLEHRDSSVIDRSNKSTSSTRPSSLLKSKNHHSVQSMDVDSALEMATMYTAYASFDRSPGLSPVQDAAYLNARPEVPDVPVSPDPRRSMLSSHRASHTVDNVLTNHVRSRESSQLRPGSSDRLGVPLPASLSSSRQHGYMPSMSMASRLPANERRSNSSEASSSVYTPRNPTGNSPPLFTPYLGRMPESPVELNNVTAHNNLSRTETV